MRLPRPRFTVRRLMVVVAILALALTVYAGIERRRARLQRVAQHHWEKAAANSVVQADANRTIYRASASLRNRQLAHYHVNLAYKYANAARYPWLPVAPDPPEPE
jgi:hypothetical protein